MADYTKRLQNMKDVPYIVFESEMARLERVIKKMFILLVVTVCLLVGTNAYWIWYDAQFTDEITVTQTAISSVLSKSIYTASETGQ